MLGQGLQLTLPPPALACDNLKRIEEASPVKATRSAMIPRRVHKYAAESLLVL